MEITVKGYDVEVPDDFTSWDAPAQNALLDEIEAEIDTNVRTEDKAAYDALPWYEQAATAAGDVGTLAVKGAMDLGAGAVNLGGNALGYDPQLSRQSIVRSVAGDEAAERSNRVVEAAQNRAGSAGVVAEAIPAIAMPLARAPEVLGMGGRIASTALQGAGYGAATASGQGEAALPAAIAGGVGGAGGQLLGEGVAAVAPTVVGKLGEYAQRLLPKEFAKRGFDAVEGPLDAVAERAALKTEGSRLYDQANQMGIYFKPEAINRMYDDVARELGGGFDADLILPQARTAIEKMANKLGQGKTISWEEMHDAQKLLKQGFTKTPDSANSNRVVGIIMDRLRGTMYDAAGMGPLYGIPTEELAPVVTKAGQNWAKQAKIKEVSDLIESGRQQGSRNISANERQAIKRKIGTITPMHRRSSMAATPRRRRPGPWRQPATRAPSAPFTRSPGWCRATSCRWASLPGRTPYWPGPPALPASHSRRSRWVVSS